MLICDVITHVRLLHTNCYHTKIYSADIYLVEDQNNNLYFFYGNNDPLLGFPAHGLNVSSRFFVMIQYCGEPPRQRGSVLGLRPPEHNF